MNILQRHMLWRLVSTLSLCLIGFFMLAVLFDLYDTLPDMIHDTTHPPAELQSLIFQYYFLQIPKLAQMVMPISILFSVLIVLGTASRNQEVVVVQASGIGLQQLCWPFFAVSGSMTLLLLFFNFYLSPEAEMHRRDIRDQIRNVPSSTTTFQTVAYASSKTNHIWYLKEIDVEKGTFLQGEILVRDSDGKDLYKLFSAQGTFQDNHWNLANVRKIPFSKEGNALPPVDMDEYDAVELTDTPAQIVAPLRSPEEMNWPDLWNLLSSGMISNPALLSPYQTENYERMSEPFLCMVLCFFGVAFGVSHHRRNIATPLLNCILIMFVTLIWMHYSKALGKGSRMDPFFAAWNGIFVFGISGFLLFAWRVGWFWLWQAFLTGHEA